jgi:hypothetical protein
MRTSIDLYLEMTREGRGVGHVLDLPGCHLRGESRADILSRAPSEVRRYLAWCGRHGVALRPAGADEAAQVVRIIESLPGAPLWESGNPAALFQKDRVPLDDEEVRLHFRVVRAACDDIARAVSGLDPAHLRLKPAPDRRSLEETLTHIGNCLWWYCSRLSDDLAEPDVDCPPRGLARIEHLLPFAERQLLEFPRRHRGDVIVPRRSATSDPQEPWTHRKACRRQAEHVLEHLAGVLKRAEKPGSFPGGPDEGRPRT